MSGCELGADVIGGDCELVVVVTPGVVAVPTEGEPAELGVVNVGTGGNVDNCNRGAMVGVLSVG